MTGDAEFSWDPRLPTDPGFDWAAGKHDLFGFDTTTPLMSRVWNFLGGGKDNFPADRNFGACVQDLCPQIARVAHYRHVFRARAVRAMIGQYGIGQLLVAGVDLPLRDEVHDIALGLDPRARVLYADPDPWVMVHAQALLAAPRPGACEHIEAGLGDPAALLDQAARILNPAEPVGVLLITSLDGLDDVAAAHAMGALNAALPHGSCIALCHLTGKTGQGLAALGALGARPIPALPRVRTPAAVRALFAGLDLAEPGVVPAPQWRPEPSPWQPEPVDLWCGLGRIPRPGGGR